VALIGRHEVAGNVVLPDNPGGGAAAADALLALGHTDMGVIAGPATMTVSIDRLAGFAERCAAAGHAIPGARIVPGQFTRDSGGAAMRTLLEVAPEITAVFCLSDAMAIGALRVLREHGIAVPERMSVLGFDDILVAEELSPPLSTVRVPMKDMGAAAMRLILEHDGAEQRSERFATELRLRGTTGPPPARLP
jgi:LacI family transcriptional regulator